MAMPPNPLNLNKLRIPFSRTVLRIIQKRKRPIADT